MTEPKRRIRSFTRREGRLTNAQRLALENDWEKYGLESHQALNPVELFSRSAPLILEIGFGNGEALAAMAEAHPENDYIGVEIHRPGIGHLILQMEKQGLSNVRIYCADAVDILEQNIADQSLTGIHLFFPDPWPKKRHHKRRLVTPDFIELAARKLKPEGYFHAATDWQAYADRMLFLFEQCPYFKNKAGPGLFFRQAERPITKFEQRGLKLGHQVWDLIFERC